MGMGFTLHCRKCGYSISGNLGVGFFFPSVYQRTMAAARSGKLGETLKTFLDDHPDGALNTENVFLQCTDCGSLEFGQDLSMYIRNSAIPRREQGRWSVAAPYADEDYVSPMELERENTYELYGRGNTCKKCGKPMKPISDNDLEEQMNKDPENRGRTEIGCPVCKELLWVDDNIMMWD